MSAVSVGCGIDRQEGSVIVCSADWTSQVIQAGVSHYLSKSKDCSCTLHFCTGKMHHPHGFSDSTAPPAAHFQIAMPPPRALQEFPMQQFGGQPPAAEGYTPPARTSAFLEARDVGSYQRPARVSFGQIGRGNSKHLRRCMRHLVTAIFCMPAQHQQQHHQRTGDQHNRSLA